MDIRSCNSRSLRDDVRDFVVRRRMAHDGKKQAARMALEALRFEGSQQQIRAWASHREQLLDEALKEAFPASDPPSIALPPRRKWVNS